MMLLPSRKYEKKFKKLEVDVSLWASSSLMRFNSVEAKAVSQNTRQNVSTENVFSVRFRVQNETRQYKHPSMDIALDLTLIYLSLLWGITELLGSYIFSVMLNGPGQKVSF